MAGRFPILPLGGGLWGVIAAVMIRRSHPEWSMSAARVLLAALLLLPRLALAGAEITVEGPQGAVEDDGTCEVPAIVAGQGMVDFTVRNDGDADLFVYLTEVGPGQGCMTSVLDGLGQVIAPGAEDVLSIGYDVTEDPFSFPVLIYSSDQDENFFEFDVLSSDPLPGIALSVGGTGLAPGSTWLLSPDAAAGTRVQVPFTVYNPGGAPLHVSSVAPSAPVNAVCEVMGLVPFDVPVAGQGSFVLQVTAGEPGAYGCDLRVFSDAPDALATFEVTVQGTAAGPVGLGTLVLDGQGDVEGTIGAPVTMFWALSNLGDGALAIHEMVIEGPDADAFALGLPVQIPIDLAAGDFFSFETVFTAERAGTHEATLVIVSDTGGFANSRTVYDLVGTAAGGDEEEDKGIRICASTGGATSPGLAVLALLMLRRRPRPR